MSIRSYSQRRSLLNRNLKMKTNILSELCEIIHGLGERMPRKDTVEIIQSVLIKQMILLIYQIRKAAILLNDQSISIKHLLYVLKNHKVTVIRILSYYLLKDSIQQLSKLSDTDENQEKKEKHKNHKLKLVDQDIVENIPNFENGPIKTDPAVALAAIDFATKDLSTDYTKAKSLFKILRNEIVDLKLEINITEEEVRKCDEKRLIRANDISIILTASGYEGFEACRRKSFRKTKTGELLLVLVHKALPWDVKYNNQVKDVLLFLAKETINCLIDRVFENRKRTDNCDESNSTIIKKKKYGSILVNEITAVITSTWKTPLEEIHYPYDENDTFFNNQLIFEL